MASPTLVLTDTPSPQFERLIGDNLDAFNQQITGQQHAHSLAVVITEPDTGNVLGGLIGRTSLGLLFVDLIFVPESLRGTGLGAQVMRLAEAEAIRRGCSQAVLYTIAFQAPDFYRRLGYEAFGKVESGPAEQARIFMRKDLHPH